MTEFIDEEKFLQKYQDNLTYFQSGSTRDIAFRINCLKKLREKLKEYDKEICTAIHQDMGRADFEAYGAELGVALSELGHTLKNMKRWLKPKKISAGLGHFPSKSYVQAVPRGNILIIGAYNYPVNLAIVPLINAIAAGNTAIIKPSEHTTNTNLVIKKLISEVFDENHVSVVFGGPKETQFILKQKYGLIVFTGSQEVGKIIARHAAETLTPTVLELGGKSPAIVAEDANIPVSSSRIAFAKFLNASQTCVAPDYVLVHETIINEFISQLKESIISMYGENPKLSPDFARMINSKQFNRAVTLLSQAKDFIVYGGDFVEEELYVGPTIIRGSWDELKNLDLMHHEIFAPILPIIPYSEIVDVIQVVDHSPEPLGLYIFSKNKAFIDQITTRIPSGDICINEAALQFSVPGFPVGGIGNSGMWAYRGEKGFDQFVHYQSVLNKSTKFDLSLKYPPYTNFKEKLVRFLLR